MDNLVDKDKIILGIIGYNEGNGHPYSFSAIINGYDQEKINSSPYPVIGDYLSKRDASEFGVHNFSVEYIWTPFREISEEISECCYIKNVANHYSDFIDKVDGIIIARDDADSHKEIAKPFLEKGKFVFIDKPLASNIEDLNFFIPYLKNGQLMSCSGFRFHPQNIDKKFIENQKDKIVYATAVTTIDWNKYGIHMLEAIQPLMGAPIKSVHNIGVNNVDFVYIEYSNGKKASIFKENSIRGFSAKFFTNDASHFDLVLNDNFTYFRNLLFEFYNFIIKGETSYSTEETINLIKALIASKDSKESSEIKHIN